MYDLTFGIPMSSRYFDGSELDYDARKNFTDNVKITLKHEGDEYESQSTIDRLYQGYASQVLLAIQKAALSLDMVRNGVTAITGDGVEGLMKELVFEYVLEKRESGI